MEIRARWVIIQAHSKQAVRKASKHTSKQPSQADEHKIEQPHIGKHTLGTVEMLHSCFPKGMRAIGKQMPTQPGGGTYQ